MFHVLAKKLKLPIELIKYYLYNKYYYNYVTKKLQNFIFKIVMRKLACQILCRLKTKWFIYFSYKNKSSEAKVLIKWW